MKKILWMIIAALGMVLVVGTALAAEKNVMVFKDPTADPDSMINTLDPSNAPVRVVPAHRGLLGLTEEGLPGVKGAAAGGMGEKTDSLINDLDPSNAPGARIMKGSAVTTRRDDPDSFIHIIAPPSYPN